MKKIVLRSLMFMLAISVSITAQITYVGNIGTATIKDNTNNVLTLTTTAAVTAGNDIIVAYATDPIQNLVVSVTDNVGNTYNQVGGYAVSSGNLRTYIFAAYNVTYLPSSSTITFTQSGFSGTAPAARVAAVSVFSGLANSNVLDQTKTGSGSGTTPSSGATSTTMQTNELLIGAIGTEGPGSDAAGTWGSSFTTGPRVGTTATTTDAEITVSMGWRIVSSTGMYTASKSGITSRDWAAMIATFKSSSSGGPITFTGTELLARPTDHSITLNVVSSSALDAYAEYGTTSGVYTNTTTPVSQVANEPVVIVIDGLNANTKYYYRLRYRVSGSGGSFSARDEYSFRTQRAAGSTFTFDITSDSHVNILLGSGSTWQQTLDNIADDNPDFLLDLGDTFAMDNVSTDAGAKSAYLFQRPYFGTISHSSSVFLALGNHEEEEGWHLDDYGNPVNSQPVWSTNARKKYFPNPVPDDFYSGNTETYYALDGDQLHEDYYAWTWGDALFVVIDPFWYTTTKPFTGNMGGGEGTDAGSGDRWDWTLGLTQYNWLKQTLENSGAAYKFIFAHHMVGGSDDYVREGAYGVPYCEWGGYNENGTTLGFNIERPGSSGWDIPIHQMLVNNEVTAFFHGHDHQYAHEIRDNVIYESLPSAGFSGNGFGLYSESDPMTIRVLPSPGYIRVTVSSGSTIVDLVSSTTGQVIYTYTIDNPLPVELSTFSAIVMDDGVKLNWRTETEVNNYGFDVERCKKLDASGETWEKIGFVNGNGNSNSPKNYNFEDMNITADKPAYRTGRYSYRLKQIDNDGQFEYSKVIEVYFGIPNKFELSQNYPNPFNPSTTISYNLPEATNVKITVFNILGQEIKTLVNEFKESGVHTINFDASELNSGMYIYKIEAGSFTQTRKMTLVK